MAEQPSGAMTLLFTDIVGSTRLWERHRSAMSAALARHDTLLQEAVQGYNGHIFKTTGDGCCAVFADAAAALSAAIAAQRALAAEPWKISGSLGVRMALHSGSVEQRGGDYLGPALNRLARLVAAAHGGQILVSLVTAELARDQLPADVVLRDLGIHRLKDLTRPERIFQLIAPGLEADFPPLRTIDRHRHNLPTQSTPFIGREWEVRSVLTLLHRDDVRLVTLSGPGGTGKTRLGLQAAAELLDQFADGVTFVALAPVSDPNLVAAAIAHALGARETAGQTLLDQLANYLRDKQLLLVLDNFEHLLEAAPLVAALLVSTLHLKVLITSRAALRLSAEHEYGVAPLMLPDSGELPSVDRLCRYESVRLFVERAQTHQPAFVVTTANATAVADICRRLDGLPLAIELAAARIKLFAPRAMLDRLRSPLAFLTAGARDLPPRQQTLRAAIDWSYQLLTHNEQQLFTQIAVFVDGCTVAAAEAICMPDQAGLVSVGVRPHREPNLHLSDPMVVNGIAALLEQSLLQQTEETDGEWRFGMLETIREYALERLQAQDATGLLRQRHAAYFLALAENGAQRIQGAEQGVWLSRLASEQGNMRAALEWWSAVDPEQGLRMAVALWRFWELRGYLSEGRARLRDLLDATEDVPAPLRAHALHGAGVLACQQGSYPEAQSLLAQSLALFQAQADSTGVAHVLVWIGLVAWFQGDQEIARAQLEESVALFRSVQHTWGTADALHYLGHVVLDQGDATAAYALFEESLALFQISGDARNIALPLKDLGLIASQRGDFETAIPRYEASLALSRKVADLWHVADTLQRLGDLARITGDDVRAIACYQESLDVWQRLGNRPGVAEALNLLGKLAQSQHRLIEAHDYFTESLAIQRALGSKRMIATVLYNLGQIAQQEGDLERAAAWYTESLTLNMELGYRPGIADGLVGIAALDVLQGNANRAAELLGAAEQHIDAIRGFMPLTDRSSYTETIAATRKQLAIEAFDRAWAVGQALSLDAAVARALAILAPHEFAAPQDASPVDTSSTYPAGLTHREVEVLRLVAQGLADAQVAEALVVSPRTVHGHLRSIYSKLGVSSRTAAARFAIEHQLS